MKRLVYIVLMLICMVEGVKGTERLDSILHQYMLNLEADEDPYVFKYAIHVVSLVGQTQDKELAQAYLKKQLSCQCRNYVLQGSTIAQDA